MYNGKETDLRKSPKRTSTDPLTGRTIHHMDLNGAGAVLPYITQRAWDRDGRRFVVGDPEKQALYLYDTEEETLLRLDDACIEQTSANATITPENLLFYTKGRGDVYRLNLDTGEKSFVAALPPSASAFGGIQVTNDGTRLTGYLHEPDEKGNRKPFRLIPLLDVASGEWDLSLTHDFSGDAAYPDLGHPIVNPVYRDLIFFCHEGKTEDIPDRLWLADAREKTTRLLVEQARRADGANGETVGHETWTADGEQLFFVKYFRETNIGKSGIVRIDKDGANRDYINDDYSYWHVSPDPDKKWAVADTQIGGKQAEICLIQLETRASRLLCKIDAPYPNHPYHPHPVFSPDGKKICFQMASPGGGAGAAWMELSDLL